MTAATMIGTPAINVPVTNTFTEVTGTTGTKNSLGYTIDFNAVYDGKIIRIDRNTGTVVFRQDINDPRSIKPYRDVSKRLTTAEEGSL